MSQNEDYSGFFGGGEQYEDRDPAGSARFKEIGDEVVGEIVDVYSTVYKDFNTGKPVILDDGSEERQLVITLQTQHRNWDAVTKVPERAVDDKKVAIPANEDTGRRNVYVRKGKNLSWVIGDALVAAGVPAQGATVKVGDFLKVRFADTKQFASGTAKQYEAQYKRVVQSDPFATSQPPAQPAAPAPAQPAPQAPPAPDPFAAPAAPVPPQAPAQPSPPADPWASPAPAQQAPVDPFAAPAAPNGTEPPPF